MLTSCIATPGAAIIVRSNTWGSYRVEPVICVKIVQFQNSIALRITFPTRALKFKPSAGNMKPEE